MTMRRTSMVLAAAVVVLAVSCGHSASTQQAAPATTTSSVTATGTVGRDSRVGAVFLGGQSLHVCSGSVLDSAAGDLILTAAHCMADGVEACFVPGFSDQADPADYWRIDVVYLDPRWLANQDPLADFAIARVSRERGGTVEQLDGGFALGAAPKDGTEVKVNGYALGVGGEQVACHARSATHRGFPSLLCAGLVDGTSGSPWLADSVITGVVGGLDGGGCEENVSYSPPFDDTVKQLLHRAEVGGPGDAAPTAFEDGC